MASIWSRTDTTAYPEQAGHTHSAKKAGRLMGMKRMKTTMGLALTGAFLLTACNAGASTDGGSATGGSGSDALTVGLFAEPASLDFTTVDGAAIPQALLDNVYETLVTLDQEGNILPALAESYEVSDDGLAYTFQLQQGVTFSNGEDFTAADAVFSINQVKSDDWTISLKSQMDVVESAEATGDHELTVTLSEPSNAWLYSMTTRIGAMFDENGTDNLAEEAIGTGPFVFDSWDRGNEIVLNRNDDYWGEEPYFNEVTLRYFNDGNAVNNAMLTGSIDLIGTVQAPESLAEFEGDDFQIIEGTTNGEIVLSFNNGRAPFDDLRVRQAARYAIDNQALMDTCWAGRGELIGSMVPPTDPWYEDRTGDYEFDTERAAALLEDADATGVDVALRLPSLPYAVACGTVVESMLEDAGFNVTVDELEFPAAWVETVFTAQDYDMSIVSHVEPRDLGNVFGNPDYYTAYGTPELQEILERADRGTVEEQTAAMQEAATMVSEDAAAEFLFLLPNLMVAEPGITGVPTNLIGESLELSNLARSE
ncbi:ABC transporter substrate-binding protein [Ornithinimicrobium sp. INDO-MA30-4]|uniref:ABC transporter substrate-binding protein n=1 Tax=Ornithinimicrobium sp. INDO-MA30-4 TaxID=2908651 RepID=UPI001F2BFC7E|nr:ABC transporter substrate-binding protein [Ornithinimicrobium sp. INDO-MA30-4]UJH69782.1 ABC transporter substrate-binding protein [Ornithinimicrobium sp. INDO-MA30-4]